MNRTGIRDRTFLMLFALGTLVPLSSLAGIPHASALYNGVFLIGSVLFAIAASRPTDRVRRVVIAWSPVLLILIFGIAVAGERAEALKTATGLVARGFLPAMALQLFYESAEAERLVRAMAAIAALAAVNGLLERIVGRNIPYDGLYRAFNPDGFALAAARGGVLGTAGYPVPYGVFLSLFVPVCAAFPGRSWPRWLTIPLLAGVAASMSRSAVLSSAVGLVVAAALRYRGSLWRRGAAALAAAALSLAAWFILRHSGGRHFHLGLTAETHRLAALKMADVVLSAHPFSGLGLGQFSARYDSFRASGMIPGFGTADNQYLRWTMELGLPGGAALLWLLFNEAGWLGSAAAKNDGLLPGIAGAVSGGAIAFAFFDGYLWIPTQIAFWSLAGCGAAMAWGSLPDARADKR